MQLVYLLQVRPDSGQDDAEAQGHEEHCEVDDVDASVALATLLRRLEVVAVESGLLWPVEERMCWLIHCLTVLCIR